MYEDIYSKKQKYVINNPDNKCNVQIDIPIFENTNKINNKNNQDNINKNKENNMDKLLSTNKYLIILVICLIASSLLNYVLLFICRK